MPGDKKRNWLARLIFGEESGPIAARDSQALSLAQWFEQFMGFGSWGINQTLTGKTEEISSNFRSLVQQAYQSNGIVFACELVRFLLFSEARFQFRQIRNGKPGDLFGTRELEILETPWPNGTTGDLLTRALLDADLAGNHFATRRGGRIIRMRPDWVSIILGSRSGADLEPFDLDTELVGYAYYPGGRQSGAEPEILGPDQVAHFAPIPDPLAMYRGMSWLTPVVREIMGDSSARDHKLKFFEQGGTPNMIIKLDVANAQQFADFVKRIDEQQAGAATAYKTLYLGAGADPTVIGSDFRQMDFKVTQGAGETRIAAAAGVPPVIAGFSEGLQAATYSNYSQARRRFSDGTMWPLWRNVAGSYANLVNVPPRSELWIDAGDIPFLREDEKDAAEIQQVQASAIKQLVDAGFEAESVIAAITSGDMSRLSHTGLFSVQLQPPNPDGFPSPEDQAGRALAMLLDKHLVSNGSS